MMSITLSTKSWLRLLAPSDAKIGLIKPNTIVATSGPGRRTLNDKNRGLVITPASTPSRSQIVSSKLSLGLHSLYRDYEVSHSPLICMFYVQSLFSSY